MRTTQIVAGLRGVLWWIRAVMGDLDYARYVEHTRRNHSDAPIMSEQEFWQKRHAAADANPGVRCC